MKAVGSGPRCLRTLIAVVVIALGTHAEAQDRAGVVTTLEGHVTVTRASLPQPTPLKFKDDIFVRDRIATSKDSVARILLGGRAVVTVREHSTVTITEAPGVATVDVTAGRVAVAVARERMRAGDLIEVKTPNAVAGIRGTVIVAEVLDAEHSVVTVLKGTIDVTRLEAGRLVGTATVVDALQRVTIAGRAPVLTPQRVAPAAARQLGREFRFAPPRLTPTAAAAAVTAVEVDRAAKDLAALAPRRAFDRRLRTNPVDDDPDDIAHEGRAVVGRDTADKVGKSEVPTAVKSSSRSTDTITTLTDAPKYSDRGGRKSRDRDRY